MTSSTTHDELIEAAAKALCEAQGKNPFACVRVGPDEKCQMQAWEVRLNEAKHIVATIEPLIRDDEQEKWNEVTDAMADAALARSNQKDLNYLTNTAAMKEIVSAAIRSRMEEKQ